jgi:hypothetical protein
MCCMKQRLGEFSLVTLFRVNGVSICNIVTWRVMRRTVFVVNKNSTLDFHYDVVS